MNNTDLLLYQLRDGTFITSVSGIIYTPIILILLILLSCVYKSCKTTLQRLTLYYVLIALLCECMYGLHITANYEASRWSVCL